MRHRALLRTLSCASLALPSLVACAGDIDESRVTRSANAVEDDVTGCPFLVRGDFNLDCQPDLLFQNGDSGRTVVWTQHDLHRLDGRFTNPMGYGDPNWKVTGVNDFNGDGMSDIVYQHAFSHDIVIGLFDGFDRIDTVWPDPWWSAYDVRGSGDYNGDGMADLILQDPETDEVWIWLLDGLVRLQEAPLIPQIHDSGGAIWTAEGGADFDQDGQDDMIWRNPDDGSIDVWLLDGRQLLSNHSVIEMPGATWQLGAVGQYGTDGAQTIILQKNDGVLETYTYGSDLELWYVQLFDPDAPQHANWRLRGPR